ncbi:TRAP transporter small permease [Sphaerochaeta globosa]|uniref:Tripartite ATP-independent periplasmic transporter DctQ component n=1 Tax=Sphaerochaeta globosa (strain ATCC BAA-1886 / DSM 22777 / Buddy) TaxID=158189 RepID=F0RVQ3_SPHGB|nr:TRAP transporter small permease [Sphaerochaeta globosa]ADY13045.1 Tripartite ATP-independent periplasmic transporter DctQ component [Sphaerochaeta globosa str. Buddy]
MRETKSPYSSKVRSYLVSNHLIVDVADHKGLHLIPELLRTLNHWTHKLILYIAQVALALMVVLVILTVVLRYVFNTGIGWAEEVPRLLVTLFAFLACAIGVRDHMHISVNILYNSCKEGSWVRKALVIFTDVCILLCGLFLLVYGWQYTKRLMSLPGTLPMTGWPTFIQYIPAPLAGFVMTFDSLLFLTGILDREELLYSEKEVDYTKIVKQQHENVSEGRS